MSGNIAAPYSELGIPGAAASLDLFSNPLMSSGILRSFYTELLPNAPISNTSSTISFDLDASPQMLDLTGSFYYIKFKVTNADGTDLAAFTATSSVGTVNAPAVTIFKDVILTMNGTQLSSNYGLYGISSMFQIYCNYGEDASKSLLQLTGYYSEADPDNLQGFQGVSGYHQRCDLLATSKSMSLIAPIFLPAHQTERLFPSMLKCSWSFVKQSNEFFLKTNDTSKSYKYVIEDLRLYIKKVELYPSANLELEKRFANSNVKIPLNHFYTRDFTIPAAVRSYNFDNVFSSSFLPTKVLVALENQSNFTGSLGNSPLSFQPFNLTDLYFTVDNVRFPSIPYDLTFTPTSKTKDWSRGFFSLFNNSFQQDAGIYIDLDRFKSGYCIFQVNFEENSFGQYFTEKKLGSCRLSLNFGPNTNGTLKCLIYAQFNEVLEIQQNRELLRNFQL